MIAGPNGSGKSSVIKEIFNSPFQPPSLYINADDITSEIIRHKDLNRNNLSQDEIDTINVKAANMADQQRQSAIENKQSFITETVMSTQRRVDLLKQAKDNGFETHLIFVSTQSPSINKHRVKNRVTNGGHNVAPEKIVSRYHNSMELLPGAVQAADTAKVYNNSLDAPILILEKTIDKQIHIYPQNEINPKSKWTPEKLQVIKQNIIKQELINNLSNLPNIDNLNSHSKTKDIFNAYAKKVLMEKGQCWTDNTNGQIIAELLKNKIPQYRIPKILEHSPEPLKNPQALIQKVANSPELKTIKRESGYSL